MTKSIEPFIEILGKDVTTQAVRKVIREATVDEMSFSAPSRIYYVSRTSGLDLLAEHDRLKCMFVYLETSRRRPTAYAGLLPFGLGRDMTQQDVHKRLGKPYETDEENSRFKLALPRGRTKVYIDFGDKKTISRLYISIDDEK